MNLRSFTQVTQESNLRASNRLARVSRQNTSQTLAQNPHTTETLAKEATTLGNAEPH